MKILVVNADCLMRNSSANLCHLAYIRGLVDAGHEVSVLSADGRDYMLDETMQIPENVHSFTIYGVSLYEKLSMRKSRNLVKKSIETDNGKSNLTSGSLNSKIKEIVRSLYGPHGIYLTFVHKACGFKLKEQFDVLLSISTPPASHLLAYKLLKKKIYEQHIGFRYGRILGIAMFMDSMVVKEFSRKKEKYCHMERKYAMLVH